MQTGIIQTGLEPILMRRVMILVFLLFILTACDTGDGGSNQGFAENQLVVWDRSPDHIVFQVDVVGGRFAESFLGRNHIPLCTIYGDNRIVWTNELNDFDVQVLWDQLTDQQIQDFIAFEAITQVVFNSDAQADLQIPGEVRPVVEVITVNVNDREHKTDSYSTQPWPGNYFSDQARFCKQVSRAPVLFEPTGAWLSVQAIEFDSTRPLQIWDSAATGLDFKAVAEKGEREWIEGQNLRILWNMVRESSAQTVYLDMDSSAYEVALEVPGVHPSSPPAPQ
jgi:hypothetical protein